MKKEIPGNGLHTEYYDSGQKSSEVNYKNAKRNGKTISWFENGQKRYEDNYKDGKLVTRI